VRICLAGFEFISSNKGCEALTYSFMPILRKIFENQPLEIVVLNIHESLGKFPQYYPEFQFVNLPIHYKSLQFWKHFIKKIKSCDIIFDITHGDSFSDIYGISWFFKTTILKEVCLVYKKPLILLPQTYGPFRKKIAKKWAAHIINHSVKAYTRDGLSQGYMCQTVGCNASKRIASYTDLAFALPYVKSINVNRTGIKKYGINVSGLLWNDCEKKKKLNLKTDYQAYCRVLVRRLLEKENVEVHLVPHVICDSREGTDYFENDCKAIRSLLNEFPRCQFYNDFATPMDAKSYISGLDCLIAARMHASIAAYSAGVACIPFAYSQKFSGLYERLNYPYVVDGTELNTEEAVEKTFAFLGMQEKLSQQAVEGMQQTKKILDAFQADLVTSVALLKGEK